MLFSATFIPLEVNDLRKMLQTGHLIGDMDRGCPQETCPLGWPAIDVIIEAMLGLLIVTFIEPRKTNGNLLY